MAASGTYNTWDISLIIEEAYERAGLEMRSGYDLRTGIRSFNFLMAEWANQGLNMWTFEEGTQAITAADGTYTMPANTVDLIEYAIRDSDNIDRPLERLSVSQWANLSDKTQTGEPTCIFIQRGVTDTVVNLWPVPDSADTYTLVYWRLRRIQEAGSITNTADLPFRFIPALTAGLAYNIALKKSPDAQRIPFLKAEYEVAFALAADEDRDRASVFLVPDLS